MSDDDDFMQDSDQEEYVFSSSIPISLIAIRYDFEYEDDDEEQGGDVGIENKYYNAKQMKIDEPEAAVDEFLEVPDLEEEKGDW